MKRPRVDGQFAITLLFLAAPQRLLQPSIARAAFIDPRRLLSQLSSQQNGDQGRFRSPLYYTDKARRSKDRDEYHRSYKGPFPTMPSQIFVSLAQSQFELLANSLYYPSNAYSESQNRETEQRQKIQSIALYLPQENSATGQLEFLPAIVYPFTTTSERIFIASDSESGIPPSTPQTLSKLPGFTHAKNLIPTYPFVTSRFSAVDTVMDPSVSSSSFSSVAIGSVEEVMYDSVSSAHMHTGNAALSLPLYRGDSTLGILLVWPASPPPFYSPVGHAYSWTEEDKRQISRAGQSLALALSLDRDRDMYQSQNEQFRVAVSDTLHQIKNPLQAVRTFAKLLQRQIAISRIKDDPDGVPDYGFTTTTTSSSSRIPTGDNTTSWTLSNTSYNTLNLDLMKLADNMVLQSARAADLLNPMNDMIRTMETTTSSKSNQPLLLPPTSEKMKQDLALIHMQQVKGWKEVTNNPNASNKQSSWLTGGSKLAMKMTFISDILEPLLQSEKVLASDRGIHFEVEGLDVETSELPGVLICPQALQEALVNVLDNAITYVKMGHRGQADVINPSPHIRVRVQANDPSIGVGVTILIEDNGPGVPPSEHQSIFSRGYRSKRTQQSSGSGIGLDISRSLIELMGGSLDIVEKSSMDSLQGAAFQIILLRNPQIKNR